MTQTSSNQAKAKAKPTQKEQSFDSLLPSKPERLETKAKRIIFKTRANTTVIVELKNRNKHHKLIFETLQTAVNSEWFESLTMHSQETYHYTIRNFISWINTTKYKTKIANRYDILKDFESYQTNIKKTQTSQLKYLKKIINQGISSKRLITEDSKYLKTLINISKPAKSPPSKSFTLSNWFDTPWIIPYITERRYLQLESPKILINSFKVTIATTLLWLLEQRSHWNSYSTIYFTATTQDWYIDWNRELIAHTGKSFKKGQPQNNFVKLMLLDLIHDHSISKIKSHISKNGTKNLPKEVHGARQPAWKRPVLFSPENQYNYSEVEELLCAWLLACEKIQAGDILKLEVGNFAREFNSNGNLIAIQCQYFKGRSGTHHTTEVHKGKDCWSRAINKYIEGLNSSNLFNKDLQKSIQFPDTKDRRTVVGFLYAIWRLEDFRKPLEAELKKNNASTLFIDTMLAFDNTSESFSRYQKMNSGSTVTEFKRNAKKPLPKSLFTLTHIKTSAVHANSDKYRESDLVNHNSHSSITEKASYITDQNKDWVNQSGRITRLVINDLQNTAYAPSIPKIIKSINSLELKTKIIKETNNKNFELLETSKIGIEHIPSDKIIVLDNEDTALYLIHYLKQAEDSFEALCRIRPDWVEKTLIINIEWMTRILSRLKSSRKAKERYKGLKNSLPNLFEHIKETST
ncbi:hypothetical protein [Bacterioplanoides pacificum]|uniref:Tyr recombinase domain-containing protein n=1 Tax=Bacterioplanoides pacificum TaxID=1171596 RepID=A0ABV7VNC3_9GAMM